jgi:hypothetical protein
MALDLSFKSVEHFPVVRTIGTHNSRDEEEEEESCSSSGISSSCEEEIESNNNNSSMLMTAINLSLPKKATPDADDDVIGEVGEEEEDDAGEGQHVNQHLTALAGDPKLTSTQLQLDIAALNLICLARLQETAAVLAGRRPLPAHLNSSSLLVTSSSSPLNRRTHRCDEPGCDKVNDFFV